MNLILPAVRRDCLHMLKYCMLRNTMDSLGHVKRDERPNEHPLYGSRFELAYGIGIIRGCGASHASQSTIRTLLF
jgi:hypothetical protein